MTEKYALVQTEKGKYPVATMCRWLNVSRSGFYEWESRPISAREKETNTLRSIVVSVFDNSRQTYGSRRVRAVLKHSGYRVGQRRLGRLMREENLVARQIRAYKRTTVPDAGESVPPDLIGRNFTATAPGEKLVGDITYIKTGEGWLYLATVIDLFSRKVIGWSMRNHMRTDLICSALTMAKQRNTVHSNAIFHSDRGSQYTSTQFAQYCEDTQRKNRNNQTIIRRSTGRTGVCYDNALAESFFGALKNEMVYHTYFATHQKAKTAIAEYIEVFYNRQRIHSTLGYKTPQNIETEYQRTQTK